ncbi:MAG TPA: DUF4326 domain-containing protein, partial [Solirubrobacteraceae bacterium]|nr:DUF4326 domain-containing protein [Solirubrobacteraceae bacterium]
YLRDLAQQTGTTFTYPRNSGQASREIARLKALRDAGSLPTSFGEHDCPAQELAYATATRPDEVCGYGSETSWQNPTAPEDPATPRQLGFLRDLAKQTGESCDPPTNKTEAGKEIKRLLALREEASPTGADGEHAQRAAVAKTAARPDSRVGERAELARYSLSSGERILYGQRIDGSVRITDEPAAGEGRTYLVETGLERDGNDAMTALVADYVQQAGQHDVVPVMNSASNRQEQVPSVTPSGRLLVPREVKLGPPRTVHSKRERHHIYIGRPSKWGNPFVVGRHGTRDECIALYEDWIVQQGELMAALGELRGAVLGCFCAPQACHGDVLLALANR